MVRQKIITEAETWIGTPWRHEGEVKGAGVDCGKLIYRVYLAAGLMQAVDVPHYSRQWMLHRDEDEMLAWAVRIGFTETAQPQPADVAIWKVGRAYSHAALVTAWPAFIHADSYAGLVLPTTAPDSWVAKLPVKFFSFGGINGR